MNPAEFVFVAPSRRAILWSVRSGTIAASTAPPHASNLRPGRRHVVILLHVLFPSLLACGCATLRSEVDAYLAGPPPFPGLLGSQDPASLTEAQIDKRLAFLTSRLDDTQLHAAAWQYGWMTINSGGAVWSSFNAARHNGTDQINDAMQAGKSVIGITYLLVDPMPGRHGADPIRALPSATRAEKLAHLEEAERLFRKTVRRSEERKSLLMHIGNVGLHVITSSVLLGLGAEKDAWMTFLIDTASGEVQIWSRPWEPVGDWEEYQRLVATGLPEEPRTSWRIAPRDRGLALLIEF